MSDTPRTDAACGFFDMETAVSADFARALERELAASMDQTDDALAVAREFRTLLARTTELLEEKGRQCDRLEQLCHDFKRIAEQSIHQICQ